MSEGWERQDLENKRFILICLILL